MIALDQMIALEITPFSTSWSLAVKPCTDDVNAGFSYVRRMERCLSSRSMNLRLKARECLRWKSQYLKKLNILEYCQLCNVHQKVNSSGRKILVLSTATIFACPILKTETFWTGYRAKDIFRKGRENIWLNN